jgi:hypothetical protein
MEFLSIESFGECERGAEGRHNGIYSQTFSFTSTNRAQWISDGESVWHKREFLSYSIENEILPE